jgi:hypothetical protein
MQYCDIEDKSATVTWTWDNGKTFKNYISTVVPIDVSTATTTATGTVNTGTWSMITYDTVTASSQFSYSGTSEESPIFSQRTITSATTNRLLYSDSSFSAGAIQARDIKFTPDPITGHKITISSVEGSKLYEEEKPNSSPPTYTVACGENCPEGSHKCTHNKYPGYCCVPCKEVGDRLKNIANKIR